MGGRRMKIYGKTGFICITTVPAYHFDDDVWE